MNTRKFFPSRLLAAALVLIALVAVWQPAAAEFGRIFPLTPGKTIELGKQGLAATNRPVGVDDVYLDVVGESLPPRFDHDGKISYRAPAMEVRFLNRNGGTVEKVSALVYVFFAIGKAERQLWFEGGSNQIAIWYVNEQTGRWQYCPTFFVDENRDNGMFDRLACLAPGSGYYVLGHLGFDELLFNPYTHQNEKVVDFAHRFITQ